MTYPSLHMIIAGERVSGDQRRTHAVVNPATQETLGALPLAEAADLDRTLDAAQRGFRRWRNSTPHERAAVLQGAARLLVERQEGIARVATMEQGKLLAEAKVEVMMVAGLFNFYAGEVIAGADSPFGGVKWSGHGAEDGPEGVEACLVTKAVHEG